jgi:hypothetical protein
MLRRLISAMAITAAAVLAPATAAAADEYGPGESPCEITFESTTVTVGEPFGFTITCPDLAGATITVQTAFAGEAAAADRTVEVAGADAESLTLDEDGTVYSSATVSAAGDYTVQVFDEDGNPLSDVYTITAVTAGGGAGGGGGLAATGSTSLPYLVVAGGLLLLGVSTLLAIRMRARRG